MLRVRLLFREAASLPPYRKWNRVQAHLNIASTLSGVRFQPEQFTAERANPLHDIPILRCDAEAQSFCVQAAIAHVVTNQLSKLGGYGSGNARLEVSYPV